jgi:hypothetical protein
MTPSGCQVGSVIVTEMETRSAPPLLLRNVHESADRAAALSVLEAAGWSSVRLAQWAAAGTVLELYDPADGMPRGAALVDVVDEGTYEVRAWAATIDTTEPGVPERLVRAVADALRRVGGRRVLASVGDADPQLLTLLLEAGFRFVSVERDAWATGARGGRCDGSRDLLWMDQDL